MALKVLHLSTFDTNGGAARAAYSLHRAMLDHGLDSEMWVGRKDLDDPSVRQVGGMKIRVTSVLDRQLWRLQRSRVDTWRSPAIFSALSAEVINRSGADIVNLHWITDGFLSIEEIGKIKKPIVWSMYDMWPFSGTEHYQSDKLDARWRSGYRTDNRPTHESGFDVDRWAFTRKLKSWSALKPQTTLIPASTWLEDNVRNSRLMHDWEITRIPHTVASVFSTVIDRDIARGHLGIDRRAQAAVFLSSGGIFDQRKGWSLLSSALPLIERQLPRFQLVVVGPIPPQVHRRKLQRLLNNDVIWTGVVKSDVQLHSIFSASDVCLVPSTLDNLPLSALEAAASGCPIAGINLGGMPDIVPDGRFGCLAPYFTPESLAEAASATLTAGSLAQRERLQDLAHKKWGASAVVADYVTVFDRITNG